ncbi:MAG TPA: hypoxanthine phosphoribosyltransferase [Terriglobales bacterium]|nr:hypoxanthine phosphoribosyltransferase [Terriglobales bacterium]
MEPQLQVLFTRQQIAGRVAELGAEITRDLAGEPVVLVGVLKGACVFLADLARALPVHATFDFLAAAAYGDSTDHSGEVRLLKDVDQSLEGKNVLLVDDILDTGLTLHYLRALLAAHQPRSLRVVTLLDKPARRRRPFTADYVGFTIADNFVVGYGMDLGGRYRNLPDICILSGV